MNVKLSILGVGIILVGLLEIFGKPYVKNEYTYIHKKIRDVMSCSIGILLILFGIFMVLEGVFNLYNSY